MAMTSTTKPSKSHTSSRSALREQRLKKRQRQRILVISIASVAGMVVLALLIYAILTPMPGRYVASQGNAHITEAQMGQFAYSTTPPTSGPHLGSLASWGVHDQPIPNELQVHNLEDGGVMVQYDCPDGCPDLTNQLRDIVDQYYEGVIVAPYPGMESRITLTAWQRIDQFDAFDEQRIVRFIRAYSGDDHHE